MLCDSSRCEDALGIHFQEQHVLIKYTRLQRCAASSRSCLSTPFSSNSNGVSVHRHSGQSQKQTTGGDWSWSQYEHSGRALESLLWWQSFLTKRMSRAFPRPAAVSKMNCPLHHLTVWTTGWRKGAVESCETEAVWQLSPWTAAECMEWDLKNESFCSSDV